MTRLQRILLHIFFMLAVLFGTRPHSPLLAQGLEDPSPLSGRWILYEDLEPQDLPAADGLEEAMARLDYDQGERPVAYVEDLDGDGASDYLLTSPEARLCGTAGCPYVLLDGRSRKMIGDFFGTLVLLRGRINRFPVIQAVSRRDIDTTNLNTFVFDGEVYRMVSHALLDSEGIEEWQSNLRSDP